MELLYHRLRWPVKCIVNYVVYAAEVIDSIHDIINLNGFVRDADGVCLKDVSGLLVGQTAAFDMVRIVSKVDPGMDTMVASITPCPRQIPNSGSRR